MTTDDLSTLLDDVAGFIDRFVAFTSPAQLDAAALWTMQTHVAERFDCSARLAIQSAEKGSGKTRMLEVLELLCNHSEQVVQVSTSALFRIIGEGPITLLIDEVDAIFHAKSNGYAEDLRALLNAGYRSGASILRCVGDGAKMQVKRFPCYAPVALAGIGELPDTLQDRSIVVKLKRRAPHEQVEKLRRRAVVPEAFRLRSRLEQWAKRNGKILAGRTALVPDRLADRAADLWEPLCVLGDVAGDEWAKRARAAALELTQQSEDVSNTVRLLADIRRIFEETQRDRLPTQELLDKLHADDENGWGDWLTATRLARKLKAFDVKPRAFREGGEGYRGYMLDDLADPFERYLINAARDSSNGAGPPAKPATAATASAFPGLDEGAGVATAVAGRDFDPRQEPPSVVEVEYDDEPF